MTTNEPVPRTPVMRCTTCRQTRGPFVYMANGKDYCEGCAPRCGT